jgi:hypothetical protein
MSMPIRAIGGVAAGFPMYETKEAAVATPTISATAATSIAQKVITSPARSPESASNFQDTVIVCCSTFLGFWCEKNRVAYRIVLMRHSA